MKKYLSYILLALLCYLLYENADSKFSYMCCEHGLKSTHYKHFVGKHDVMCPSCSKGDYLEQEDFIKNINDTHDANNMISVYQNIVANNPNRPPIMILPRIIMPRPKKCIPR